MNRSTVRWSGSVPDEAMALVAEMLRALESAQSQIEVLQGQVATLIVRQGLGGTVIGQPENDGDDNIGEWVDWLIERYELSEVVPACWAQHSPIREELSALRAAHAGALDELQARPSDLLAWHEGLQRGLTRIREWDRDKCRTRGHRGDSSHPPALDRSITVNRS